MNSDKFNCTTCAEGVLWYKGGSVRGHSVQGSLRRAENSGSMVEGKGILLSLRVNEDKTSVYRDYLASYL